MGFPEGRNYSRGIGDAWGPSPKWAAATVTRLAQKLAKKSKTSEIQIFAFPLIPTRATTTHQTSPEIRKTSKTNENNA